MLFGICYRTGFPDNCNLYLTRINHFILDFLCNICRHIYQTRCQKTALGCGTATRSWKWKQSACKKMLFTCSQPHSFTFIKVTKVKNVKVRWCGPPSQAGVPTAWRCLPRRKNIPAVCGTFVTRVWGRKNTGCRNANGNVALRHPV